MDSCLSRVPPVCPSPRPAACRNGTAYRPSPSGQGGMVILSRPRRLECFVDGRAADFGEVRSAPRGLHRRRPARDLVPGHALLWKIAISRRRHLPVGHDGRGCRRRSPSRWRRRTAHCRPAWSGCRLAHRMCSGSRAFPGRGAGQVVGPNASRQQLAQRARARRMVDEHLRADRARAAPGGSAHTASRSHRRDLHRPVRADGHRRWKPGRRPLRTPRRDPGHI